MTPDRRILLGAGLALPALASFRGAAAQACPTGGPFPNPGRISLDAAMRGAGALRLWPGEPPGGGGTGLTMRIDHDIDAVHPDRWLTGVRTPMLLASRPARPNGAAVLLVPGGGYRFIAFDNEGFGQQGWLNALGYTTFILLYRLPGEGWGAGPYAPLQDAQRAMRVIRRESGRFGLDPARIAVMGFSAGGHVAASLATRSAEVAYPPVDGADALPARPALAALVYPVITLVPPRAHAGSRDALLGPLADDATAQVQWSADRHVDADTPPCFLTAASDDDLVPVDSSLDFYAALRRAGRPAELHLFARGGHAFAVRLPPQAPAMQWPALFATFARDRGLAA